MSGGVAEPPESEEVLVITARVDDSDHDFFTGDALAGCDAKNKDLRETQAMQWFFQRDKAAWVPLKKFLEDL